MPVDPALAPLLSSLAAGAVSVDVPVLDPLDGRGGAGEVYRAQPEDVAALVSNAQADARPIGTDGRVHVELLNGTG